MRAASTCPSAASPWDWTEPQLWTCPRCSLTVLTREARCPRCGATEGM